MTAVPTPLDDLCEIVIGKTPFRGNSKYWGIGVRWATISDLSSETISQTKEQITELAFEQCRCKLLPVNTLLMSFKLSIGKLAFTNTPLVTNEAIAALLVKDETVLSKKYLYYALMLMDFRELADRAAKGNTLNKEKLKRIQVPLVPMQEQQRIVRVLDVISDIITQRKIGVAKTESLFKQTLERLFEENSFKSDEHKLKFSEE